MSQKIRKWITLPLDDYLAGIGECLVPFSLSRLLLVLGSAVFTWWLYVPTHELLHAAGCLLGGGEVYRIELSRYYGAPFLAKIFPIITEGSEYAGRLSGFETHGSDFTYLLTDFFPYFLTVMIGIPLLRSIPKNSSSPLLKNMGFGVAIPIAYAPFISVIGDYYEMGSILVSRLAHLFFGIPLERWRGDDLLKIMDRFFLSAPLVETADVLGVALSLFCGVLLVFATYLLGVFWGTTIIRQNQSPATQ